MLIHKKNIQIHIFDVYKEQVSGTTGWDWSISSPKNILVEKAGKKLTNAPVFL